MTLKILALFTVVHDNYESLLGEARRLWFKVFMSISAGIGAVTSAESATGLGAKPVFLISEH